MATTVITTLSDNVRELSSLNHFFSEARAYLLQPVSADTTELLTDEDYPHPLRKIHSAPPTSPKLLRTGILAALDLCKGDNAAFKKGMRNLCDILSFRAADGGEEAVDMLIEVATIFAGKVKELSLHRPDLLCQLAQTKGEWPSLISFHRDWQRENAKIIKEINLGAKHPLQHLRRITKFPAKRYHRRIVLHVFSNRLADLVEATRRCCERFVSRKRLRRRIPYSKADVEDPDMLVAGGVLVPQWMIEADELRPLCKATAKEWFEIGWAALLQLTDGNPETLPDLKGVGFYREERSKGSRRSKSFKRANIREGMKTQLWKAYHARFAK